MIDPPSIILTAAETEAGDFRDPEEEHEKK
jgi:hypothetical protein